MTKSLETEGRGNLETSERRHITQQDVEAAGIEFEQSGLLDADFLRKVRLKMQLKDELTRDDGTNTRAPWKKLGIFLVEEKGFSKNIADILRKHGADLAKNDTVLELHIPPQELRLADVGRSFNRLSEYLHANESEGRLPKYIYGISYLARFAKRYGFDVLDLPKSLKRSTGAASLLKAYKNSHNPKRKKMAQRYSADDIRLCYLPTEEFLEKRGRQKERLVKDSEGVIHGHIKGVRKRMDKLKIL